MTSKEALQLTYDVRQLQKQYFAEKNVITKKGILIRCKEKEKQLDEYLHQFVETGTIVSRQIRTGERGQQTTAF
jgi:hypothetical protein